ncbi:hypothetical protein VRU48_07655 [Pedobacter sp. KR3-3]|uniref:Uncharacterized protein n=1 Tax=Pedobacter albus TaxID=3113905 RepID=A0ABU7I6L2_9SPHI|nr:hypothetical protein [Pedobacter sp. KR3-3]MEE1944976.1 hypothetical protein [Pedobacter sp. KR3-3]
MLVVKKINAYIGLLLATIAITISPMLRIPLKGNWTLYEADPRLLYISMAVLGLTALLLFIRALGAFRVMAIITLIWSVLMVIAVWFKVHNYFGSKFFDRMLSKTIHFQWGWIVLMVGVILLATSVKKERLEMIKKA